MDRDLSEWFISKIDIRNEDKKTFDDQFQWVSAFLEYIGFVLKEETKETGNEKTVFMLQLVADHVFTRLLLENLSVFFLGMERFSLSKAQNYQEESVISR